MNRVSSRKIILLIFILILAAGREVSAQKAQGRGVPRFARQLIVVTTADWTEIGGRLQRYERARPGAPWRAVGEPFDVVVGRAGLGWEEESVNGEGRRAGPIKHEGDGRAPAGVFALNRAFGYDLPGRAEGISLPFILLTPAVECVDDVNSALYNRIVQRDRVGRVDWQSSEKMRRNDDLYRRGVIVEYNTRRPAPGRGSCIFLHLWSGPGQGTAGCTAMREADLRELLGWLRRERRPQLVQLPVAEYHALQRAWHLPN